MVKQEFANSPNSYIEFLKLMQSFKNQSLSVARPPAPSAPTTAIQTNF